MLDTGLRSTTEQSPSAGQAGGRGPGSCGDPRWSLPELGERALPAIAGGTVRDATAPDGRPYLPAALPRMRRTVAARAYVRKTLAKMSHASSDFAVKLKAM